MPPRQPSPSRREAPPSVAQPETEKANKRKWKVVFLTPSIKKEMVPLKIVLFCWYGAFSSLLPYLTIYLKLLGITASEIAFIYTFFPLAKLLGPAIGGLIADKLGRYKPVLYVALLCNVIFATSFLFIPSIPETKCEPEIHLSCQTWQKPRFTMDSCCGRDRCRNQNESGEIEIGLCHLKCHGSNTSVETNDSVCFEAKEVNFCVDTVGNGSTVRNTTGKLNILYRSELENDTCFYAARDIRYENETLPISRCSLAENCQAFCPVNATGGNGNECKATWNDRLVTLSVAFAVFMCFQIFVAICFSLVEATTLAMVKEHKDDYGRQRVWAILATAIFSPLTGFLVDVSSSYRGRTDYSPSFYIFDILMLCNIALVYILDLPIAPPAKRIMKNIKGLIVLPEVIAFLIVIFFLGTFWGFLESFLFWHLLDLQSPKYLLGLTLTVGAIVGLPFLYTSHFFVQKFGRVNLLIVAFLFYSIRCIGYSYIYNPWWFVLFEAMEASTYHLMWVAAATYAASLAPEGLLATIQGCVAGMHFGIGRGSGSLIGGNLISAFRNRIAFRSMGAAAAVLGVLYAVVYYSFLRNLRSNKSGVHAKDLSPVEASGKKSTSTDEEKF